MVSAIPGHASTALQQPVRDLLGFLRQNPLVRQRIAAGPNCTILYCGNLIKPAWKEAAEIKLKYPELGARKTLPEVLQTINPVGQPFANLRLWAESLDSLRPYETNGFIAWRALSGIFASNAMGSVTFVIGSDVTRAHKVFAATEAAVLLRNPRIDATTRELLSYYQRCIAAGRTNIGVSFIPA